MAPAPSGAEWVPVPLLACLVVSLDLLPQIEARLPSRIDTRAGPSDLAPYLRSTVLLV